MTTNNNSTFKRLADNLTLDYSLKGTIRGILGFASVILGLMLLSAVYDTYGWTGIAGLLELLSYSASLTLL